MTKFDTFFYTLYKDGACQVKPLLKLKTKLNLYFLSVLDSITTTTKINITIKIKCKFFAVVVL